MPALLATQKLIRAEAPGEFVGIFWMMGFLGGFYGDELLTQVFFGNTIGHYKGSDWNQSVYIMKLGGGISNILYFLLLVGETIQFH